MTLHSAITLLYYFLLKSVSLLNDLGSGTTFKELSKTALEKMGKSLSDDLRAQIAPINGERNYIKEELKKLKEEFRKPLTDYENREKSLI